MVAIRPPTKSIGSDPPVVVAIIAAATDTAPAPTTATSSSIPSLPSDVKHAAGVSEHIPQW